MDDTTRREIMATAVRLWESGFSLNEEGFSIESVIEANNALWEIDVEFEAMSAISFLESFKQAVDKAGGVGWPIEKLLGMNFLDLMSSLATNHVRFMCEK